MSERAALFEELMAQLNGHVRPPTTGAYDYKLDFLPQHLALLRRSAIAPAVAEARRYFSLRPTPEHRGFLHEWGFTKNQQRLPGLAHWCWNVVGQAVAVQLRPDEPRQSRSTGKGVKYETAFGARQFLDVHPHVHPHLGNPKVPLFITEGARKADAAISLGLSTISLNGVYAFRGANEDAGKTVLVDFEYIALNDGRVVCLAFDSDAMIKPTVHKALARLKALLEQRGARVYVVYLPPGPDGGKTGLDDYLAVGHTAHDLMRLVEPGLRPLPDSKLERLLTTQEEHFSDWGNAQRLVRQYGKHLRYNKALGWLWYQGQRWVRDRTGEVERCAKDVVRDLYAQASRPETSDEERRALAHHALASESAKALRDMVQVATSEDALVVTPEQLDANRWVLNVPNGTLDLETGQLHLHRAEDLLMKLAGVPYDPTATCPKFLAFLEQIFGGDAELISFVQRLGGCCLTGAVERTIIICWGSGDNGKTTLLEILRGVLGDYALTTPMTTLMAKRDGGGIPNDVARFPGARLITASESEKGQRFAQSLIKYLTGGDRQIARFLFREYFEFEPTYKLAIITNNKPDVDATDQAFWNRVRLLPFTQVIPKAGQIERYHDLLVAEEGPGILAWLVAGCQAYQAEGLGLPAAVRAATTDYRNESDRLRDFLADCCEVLPDAVVQSGDLYAAYKQWCLRGTEVPMSQTAFGSDLTAHKFAEARLGKKRQRVRTGLRLTTGWQAWADGARLRMGGDEGRRWTP